MKKKKRIQRVADDKKINKTREKKKAAAREKLESTLRTLFFVVFWIFIACVCVYRAEMLKDYGVTTCVVLDYYRQGGKRVFIQKQALVEYYVDGERHDGIVRSPPIDPKVGSKYFMKYSIEKPQIFDVLWDEPVRSDD